MLPFSSPPHPPTPSLNILLLIQLFALEIFQVRSCYVEYTELNVDILLKQHIGFDSV